MAIHRSTDDDGLTVTFVLVDQDPDIPVSVVGSFNDWTPGVHSFEQVPDGPRSVTVVVPLGVDLHFRYLGPDGYWFDDLDADEITSEGSVLRARAAEAPAADEGPQDEVVADESAADAASVSQASTDEVAVDEPEGRSEESPGDHAGESEAAAVAVDEPAGTAAPHDDSENASEAEAEADEADSVPTPGAADDSGDEAARADERPVTADESGERLKAVSEQIESAKDTARDLVDRDIIEPRPGEGPGKAFTDGSAAG